MSRRHRVERRNELASERRFEVARMISAGYKNAVIKQNVPDASMAKIERIRTNLRRFGTVDLPPLGLIGRPPKTTLAQQDLIKEFIIGCPHAYLDEIQWFMEDQLGVEMSISGISKLLRKQMRWSKKQVYHTFSRYFTLLTS